MKKITLLMILTVLTSCNITTNIVDHYDCQGKEDLLAKTYIQCVESSTPKDHESKLGENEERKTIVQNPVHACADSVKELLCSPVYKILFKSF